MIKENQTKPQKHKASGEPDPAQPEAIPNHSELDICHCPGKRHATHNLFISI